jgi:hypothetical protein
LREEKLGWSTPELSKATGIPEVVLLDRLQALYNEGAVAYLLDDVSLEQTWFDIPRVLQLAENSRAGPERT